MSLLNSKDYHLGKISWSEWRMDENKWNTSIWKIYFENVDKPIEELDELMKQKYIQYFEENGEALIQFKKQVVEQADYHFPWIYSNGDFDDYSKENFLSILGDFSFNEKGKVKKINDYGVDLNSKDVSNQLKEKGIPLDEIDEILNYNFKRNVILNKLKREKEAEESHAAISGFYETTSFSVKKLGWINCDRFYDSPDAKEAKILASNSSNNDLNFIDFSLVFPKLNARLSAFINEEGNYAFTQNGRYSKLPIGEKAIVTGISFQNDSIYYAAQEIIIEEDMKVDLDLRLTSKDELRDELSKLVD